MKRKLLKNIGLCLLSGVLLLGAVSSPCMMVNATSSQESEIDRVLTEETTELIKSAAEQQQGTKKTASQTRWNRNPEETSVTRQTYIGSGTTKIEIFYSSSVDSPQILLQAPSKKIYHPGATTAYEDTLIVYRKGYVVADYPDIKYDILYISESQDPGMWDIAFTVEDKIDEFMVITARVADDWENFHTDYKTAPTDIIIWEMSQTSHYTANDITSIVAKDDVIPTNHITETVVIETKSSSPIILTVIGVIILVIIGTAVALVSVHRAGKVKNKEKSDAIKNANKRLRLKKKKENEMLDKVLEALEYQYSDDDYFFSFADTEDTEDAADKQKNDGKELNRSPQTTRLRGGATHEISVERESGPMQGQLGEERVANKRPDAGAIADAGNEKRNYTGENTVENVAQSKTGNGRIGQVKWDDRKLPAPGGMRPESGAVTNSNNDISRSDGKFSSASPTIPETKPHGGALHPTTTATMQRVAQKAKPSWMITEDNNNNLNRDPDAEDFF